MGLFSELYATQWSTLPTQELDIFLIFVISTVYTTCIEFNSPRVTTFAERLERKLKCKVKSAIINSEQMSVYLI